jgi:Leucine-rich repeat (LRR) protein
MTKTEVKKTVVKIKKFLKQRDYDAIDTGIELARALDEPAVFESLLDGVIIGVDKWKRKELIRTNTFTGTGPAQPYLDYALWNLIGYAHQRSSIDNSIKTSNITEIILEWEKKDIKWEKIPSSFSNFNKLTTLKIRGESEWDDNWNNWNGGSVAQGGILENFDGISELTSLTHLSIDNSIIENLDFLSTHTKLESLRINCCSYLKNIDGLKNCKNLTTLCIKDCGSLENVDGLINCTKLVGCGCGMGSTSTIKSLNFEGCFSLKNVNGLINAKKLTNVNFSKCSTLEDIDGLANCTNITDINLGWDGGELITSLDGLANKKKIKQLNLGPCNSLENIEGLGSCTNLTDLTLREVYDIGSLSNCKKLESLTIRRSDVDITPIMKLKYLKSLSLDDCELNIAPWLIKGNQYFNLEERSLISAYQNKISLVVALNNNDKKTLSEYKNETSIDLSSCSGLTSVNGLAGFDKLSDLDLSNCANIEPRPSPVHMTTRAHVATYQIKLMRMAGLKIPNSYTDSALTIKKERKQLSGEEKELKPTIIKINKLLRSDNYEAGIELIKTLDDPKITKGTLKEVLKHPDYYEAGIKSVKTLDVSVIDKGIIKLLLKQRNYDAIDTGIELARALNEPVVFETLLEGCSIDEEGKLIRNKIFTGTGPAQPYLNYSLLNLIAYSSENTKIDKSLKYSKITTLALQSSYSIHSVDVLANLTNLTSLALRGCDSLENVDGLVNFPNLTSLDLRDSLKNVDGLVNLPNLRSLDLSYSLKNVDGLVNLPNLTSLNLSWCESLHNVDGLGNCTKLTSLNLSWCESLHNVDGLENCTKLTSLKLNGSWQDPMTITNIDGLANLTNLRSLDLSYCDEVQPKPSKDKMTTREEVAAYQEEIRKSMK